MFKCEFCGKSSKSHESPVMQIVAARDKEYAERDNIYGDGRGDPGGLGREIVKELRVHDKCVADVVARYGVVQMSFRHNQ